MGTKKKLKNYIKDDRPLKLKSYLQSHKINPVKVKVGQGRNLLHYCIQNGSADMLRCLLNLDCDASVQDRDGNLPLHTALQRGIQEDLAQARETLMEMVMPLLDAYPLGQDVENREGVTGHDLLNALKRKIKSKASSAKEKEQRDERVREEEEEMWRKKLSEEASFEFEEQLPRYSTHEDYIQENSRESYEQWSERIRKDFHAKQQKGQHIFWRDKKRKSETSTSGGTSGKKPRQEEDDAAEKLRKAREEMRKNFKPDPVEKRSDRLLATKKRYETKFSHLINHLAGRTLTFGCIPWPSLDINTVPDVLFSDLTDKKSESYRKYLRLQQVRWHPDKFTQKFRDHLHPDHVPKIMARVKAISQILNNLSSAS